MHSKIRKSITSLRDMTSSDEECEKISEDIACEGSDWDFDELIDDSLELEESLSERLVGLTEIFPEWFREGTAHLYGAIPKVYDLLRTCVWVTATSTFMLLTPVVIEMERLAEMTHF